MPSELEKVLAKRRSRADSGDIFENSATCSSADAASIGTKAAAKDLPPWLEGAIFVESSADSRNGTFVKPADASGDGLPPWFNAAMESGVVFYDPEGQEVVVPSSKVGAFKAALETVIEFEPEPCRVAHSPPPVVPAADSSESAARSTTADAGISAQKGCGQGYPSGAAAQPATAAASEDAETLRRELKANLQKRYFALLRSGLEPNEAAARAILEAAGHAPEEQRESSQGAAAAAGPANGESTQSSWGCAPRPRSGSGETSDSRGSKEIVVAA